MSKRLLKRWTVTEKLLSEAALRLEGTIGFDECMELLSHNELGLALDVLAAEGERCRVDAAYWQLLKKAAEVMGLDEQVKEFRLKFRLARTTAVQQPAEANLPLTGTGDQPLD
jgi:hypothetical protein